MSFRCDIISADLEFPHDFFVWCCLTFNLKTAETHVCILNAVSTDTLMQKHQAINMHSADQISILLHHLLTKLHL